MDIFVLESNPKEPYRHFPGVCSPTVNTLIEGCTEDGFVCYGASTKKKESAQAWSALLAVMFLWCLSGKCLLAWCRAVMGWLAGSGGVCHMGTSLWCYYLFWVREDLVSPVVTVWSWSNVLKCKLRNVPNIAFFFFFSLPLFTVGPLTITFNVLPSERMIIQKNPFVQSGGQYRPPHCLARYKSAILVAYSNQEKYLHHLLYYIHPFLQRQQLSYRIYLIQQVNLNRIYLVEFSTWRLGLNKKCESSNGSTIWCLGRAVKLHAIIPPWLPLIEISYHLSRSLSCYWFVVLGVFFLPGGIKLSLSGNLYSALQELNVSCLSVACQYSCWLKLLRLNVKMKLDIFRLYQVKTSGLALLFATGHAG